MFRRKTSIRQSMAPNVTIQNQKNSTLKLFQPVEIVPKWKPIRNKKTWSRFHVHSGVPQGSIRGPPLYVLHTSDFQHPEKLHQAQSLTTQQYLQLMEILR